MIETPPEPLAEALAAIPGLAAAEAGLALAKASPSLPSAAPLASDHRRFQDAVELGVQAVRDGAPVPHSAVDAIFAPATRLQAVPAFDAVLAGVRDYFQDQIAWTFRRGIDHALEVLRHRLDMTLERVRTIESALIGHQAVGTEREQADGAAAELELAVIEYEQIRDAQGVLARRYSRFAGDDPDVDLVARCGYYRDSIDVVDYWLQIRHAQASRSQPVTPAAAAYVAWLSAGPVACFDGRGREPWYPTTDPGLYLLWLATQGQPWLPTMDQLQAADTAARAALSPVRTSLTIGQIEGRAEYYAVTNARSTFGQIPNEDFPIRPNDAVVTLDTVADRAAPVTRYGPR